MQHVHYVPVPCDAGQGERVPGRDGRCGIPKVPGRIAVQRKGLGVGNPGGERQACPIEAPLGTAFISPHQLGVGTDGQELVDEIHV